MSKQMKTNDFSSAILESWDKFKVFDYLINEYSKMPQLSFHWSFKSYDGSGTIDYDDNKKLRNKFGDNDSYLALSSSCRKKYINLKPTDSLYNDPSLAIIFQRILDDYFQK